VTSGGDPPFEGYAKELIISFAAINVISLTGVQKASMIHD